jgi:broad-specificity NMP kinase
VWDGLVETGRLFGVSGAPGAGKTTVLPELVRQARGPVVMDIDELLEDGGLLGVPIATQDAAPVWPAYNRMWRRIIDMTRRSGHPVILLSPLEPSEFDGVTDWALLDCDDETRVHRLRSRGWDAAAVDDALVDARRYRTVFSTVFRTDDTHPTELARQILGWISL